MNRKWMGLALVGAMMAGCNATSDANNSQLSLKQINQAQASRTLSLHVAGPIDLALGGKILNDAGGAILTDAGAGVIAAGGGNVVAPGGGNYRVAAASTDSFSSVGKAHVQLFTLDGREEGSHYVTGEDGTVTVKAKDGKSLLAVAMFKVGGKVYRVATIVPTGRTDMPIEVDPINTMVETRVRQIVGAKDKLPAITGAKLKKVWTICNNAGITVAKEDLEADLTPQESMDRLTQVWKDAIASKVTSQADKDEIKAFMSELEALAKP